MFVTDPVIISGISLMVVGIIVPCLFWFIRNLFRISFKKDIWWFSSFLKITWIMGILLMLVGLIILIIKVRISG